ncbi:hypothetical protein [Cytobacillus massiliigabonensis]|uniref:hypothetical protein n=1 Tax=Cytobacillus massiliigabonensis TaxID=1871011 RepID=UPI000C82F7F6|nr:hypothetical protein [Cytobacillus massiliigabonensis]
MTTNPYIKTEWFDHIVDVTNGQIIQDGTRFNASRANNIEEGIYEAYNWLVEHENRLLRMQVLLELDGRAPGNSGAFSDTLDGSTNKLTKQIAIADITQAVSAGATVLTVDNSMGFVPFTEVSVYDSTNREDVLVTAIDESSKTVTVQALTNAYVKGAKIARSNSKVDEINKRMLIGEWGTFNVSVSEVI